ncbi:MAG: hypothetical protein WBA45_12430 [Microthrixaceae bacterium]
MGNDLGPIGTNRLYHDSGSRLTEVGSCAENDPLNVSGDGVGAVMYQ